MKQENFNIDNNYFEELENKILSKVHTFEKKRQQRRKILTKVVLPSALILIFLAGGFLFSKNTTTPEKSTSNYLAYNEALEYLDISDYDVSTLMDEYSVDKTISTQDNDNEIIDYLSDDNSIDYELITENN